MRGNASKLLYHQCSLSGLAQSVYRLNPFIVILWIVGVLNICCIGTMAKYNIVSRHILAVVVIDGCRADVLVLGRH